MNRFICSTVLTILISVVPPSSFAQETKASAVETQKNMASLLVFTKTAGYRHKSIEKGVSTLKDLGLENGFTITHTEDASVFNAGNLAKFELVVFLNTTMDVLNAELLFGQLP